MTGQPQTRYSSKLLPMNILTLIQVPAGPFHGGLTDHNNNLHLRFPTFPRPRSRFYHFFLETTCRPSPDLSCMQLHNWVAPSSLPQATAATLTLASSTSIRTSARKSSKRADEKSCLRVFILAGGGLSKDSHCEVAFPARLRSSIRSQVVFCASHHPLPYLFHISPSSSISTKYLAIVWEFQLASRD